jgi:4'-phosphopantetheinyl transferase
MLLSLRHPFPDATLGVWKIEEAEAFFFRDLPLSAGEQAEFEVLKAPRRMEWLAARWLLHKLSGAPQRLPLAKDTFSKPFFPGHEELACSLSHSRGLVGALLVRNCQPDAAFGLDLQVLVAKMPALAHKFVNEAERDAAAQFPASAYMDILHIYWTAKEALYKAYGLKALDFKEHLHVDLDTWDGQTGGGTGTIAKGEFTRAFDLYLEKIQLPETDNEAAIVCVCAPKL